jgi:hypothetical protein
MNQRNTMISTVTDTWVGEPRLREFLSMSSSTIRRLRKRGLPSVGSDRLRRYNVGIVLQWLSEHAGSSQV